MKLNDTVDLMLSKDDDEKLLAEYLQLCIRMRDLLNCIAMNRCGKEHKCVKQLKAMEKYRDILRERISYDERLKLLNEV